MQKAAPSSSLPTFIAPMLARPGEPFDDPGWVFEVKWDGFRAVCRRDASDVSLIGRKKTDFSDQFPELAKSLVALPRGTLLDGEICLLVDGKPSFESLLRRRHHRRSGTLVYVAFDLLYERGRPMLDTPLSVRRERLKDLIRRSAAPMLQYSDGVVGDGIAFFRRCVEQGLEGAVAKRLNSAYQPGLRSGDWLKIKARQSLACVVIGYESDDEDRLRSLIVAAPVDGELRCVGKVGSGIAGAMRDRLQKELGSRRRTSPVVPCRIRGTWVEPTTFCLVSYAEMTQGGNLRAPVFEKLIEPMSAGRT